MNPIRMCYAAALLLTLGACGAEPGGDGSSSTSSPDVPLAGIYAMDFGRTSGGTTKDAEGNVIELTAEDIAKVQKNHGADSFRIELRVDGTFAMVTEMGADDLRTGGTWKETATGVDVVTQTLNGEPAPEEFAGHTDHYLVEKGYLVLDMAGKKTYLKRQPDNPK